MSETEKVSPMQYLRQLSSVLVSRAKLMGGGDTYDGKRNVDTALGRKKALTAGDYRRRMRRNPIARRVVTTYPNATWRGIGELVENEDPNVVTPFEEAFFELSDRLHLWAKFKQADTLARMGRFAIILIGAPGKPEEELPKNLTLQDIYFLKCYSEEDVTIPKLDTDAASIRYGRPIEYTVKRAADGPIKESQKTVHWTRVIHVAEGLLEDEVYGAPALECAWDDLDDLDKVKGGGSEAFWLRAHQGYQFDLAPEVSLDKPGEEALADEVDEFLHGMRRAIRTKGVKATTLGSDVADFSSNADKILDLISAGSEIPKRLLLGSERGELASTQDRDNWNERVNDRRTEYAEPYVVRQLVDRLIEHGVLPEPAEYSVRWPKHELSDTDRASLASKMADVNQKQGETVITIDEIRDHALGYPPLEEVDPDLAEANAAALELRIKATDDLMNADPNAAPDNAANQDGGQRFPRAAGQHHSMSDKRRKWHRMRQERKVKKMKPAGGARAAIAG